MRFAHSQRGLSVFGWLVTLVVGLFLVSVMLKLIPHYLDHKSLEKIITSMEEDGVQDMKTVDDFRAHVERGLVVNNIRELDLQDVLKVTLEDKSFVVQLKYEKRESLIANLDLVAKFDNEFRVRMP